MRVPLHRFFRLVNRIGEITLNYYTLAIYLSCGETIDLLFTPLPSSSQTFLVFFWGGALIIFFTCLLLLHNDDDMGDDDEREEEVFETFELPPPFVCEIFEKFRRQPTRRQLIEKFLIFDFIFL